MRAGAVGDRKVKIHVLPRVSTDIAMLELYVRPFAKVQQVLDRVSSIVNVPRDRLGLAQDNKGERLIPHGWR